MTPLEKAIAWATVTHGGQVDKAGEPYILHPLRVMLSMHDEQSRIVAVLHDVLEDTATTHLQLEKLFGTEIANYVQILTHDTRRHEPHKDYILRCASTRLTTEVKLEDIADNMTPARMIKLDEKTAERLMKKYTEAHVILRDALRGFIKHADAHAILEDALRG